MVINDVVFNAELIDILQELISQLRANDIQLISKYKEGPTHIQICCPYHANGMERRPSAGLRKEDGIFHCFACNEIHSLPEVISFCFGHTDDLLGKFGWQWLLKNFATTEIEERKDVRLDFRRSSDIYDGINKHRFNQHLQTIDDSKRYVTEEELDKYRYIHPYILKRGISEKIVELFDIGFDANTDCITFPIRDVFGNTLFIARRSVRTKFFHYPEGVEKPLYGLYEYYNYAEGEYEAKYHIDCSQVIVCESMLDALSFWVINKPAFALNGLGNELQFKQLRELPCRKIILATDMDERGLAARKRIKQNIQNRKIVTQYFFPDGRKDANECTKEELLNLKEVF